MKFRDQLALVLGLAVLIFSLFVGVPSYMRGKAFHTARSFDGRTVTVAGMKWSFCGDVQIETDDGEKIFFPDDNREDVELHREGYDH